MTEIILVIAIFSILIAASIPFYQSFQISYELDSAVDELVQNLRRAQNLAKSSKGDSTYGLYFVSGSGGEYTLFRGDDYASRNSSYDEIYSFSDNLFLSYSLGGGQELVFSKVRGLPDNTGTVSITGINGESKTIAINSQGRIKIQ